jgi:hypothetical protein
MTNQYTERKVPALLKTADKKNSFKFVNGMVELTIEGDTVVVPTAENFLRLLKKVAVLEQRLATAENKSSRAARIRKKT